MLFLNDSVKSLNKKRLKALKSRVLPDDLRPCYERGLPPEDASVLECGLTSIDFETTGLDFAQDDVISLGGISILDGNIDFDTAFYSLLKIDPEKIKAEAAIVNHLTPEQLSGGEDPRACMVKLLDHLAGGIVLTHCQVIEHNFMLKTLGLPLNFPLPVIFLDTMQIEKSLLKHQGLKSDDVRLAQIRIRRGLPPYDGHNALSDSLATAEVLLAQISDIFGDQKPALGELLKRSQ